MSDYNKIFLSHYRTKLPLMLWGSSGYGKTSLVKAFAKKYDFDLTILHAQYLDPLALFIPSTAEMKSLGYVKMYPSETLFNIFKAPKKTVLFFDELTRAREETFNILTELLLERSVFGHKLPPHVMIVAASNFMEEDSGVRELPDAVMQRLTHLIHAPETPESIECLRSPLSKKLLYEDKQLMSHPSRFPIYDLLKASPRQLDACGFLAESGLRGDDLIRVCRGRLGLEAGTELAVKIELSLSGIAKLLPEHINEDEFSRIARAENKGGVLEVSQFLNQQMKYPDRHRYIAQYLLEYATPETCRAMQIYGFSYVYPAIPKKKTGENFTYIPRGSTIEMAIETPARPWQWYCVKLGKLQSR